MNSPQCIILIWSNHYPLMFRAWRTINVALWFPWENDTGCSGRFLVKSRCSLPRRASLPGFSFWMCCGNKLTTDRTGGHKSAGWQTLLSKATNEDVGGIWQVFDKEFLRIDGEGWEQSLRPRPVLCCFPVISNSETTCVRLVTTILYWWWLASFTTDY